MSRQEWVIATMPVWTQLAEPVATSIANSLTSVLEESAPADMDDMLKGASKIMRNVGGTLFAMQLGQVVGQLSSEVVSGGDIGIPLLDDAQAAIVPQNAIAFGAGLLVSSLIPASEKEREAADALKTAAEPLTKDLTETAKELAEGLKEPAQEAMENVKATATDATEHVKDEGQDAVADVKDRAADAKDNVQ